MKRKFVCGIVFCLALSMAGCGKNSEEYQAANYYQNELGLDKEEAEELAHELYGNDDEDTNIVEEESGEIVVEPLPELLNSEWYEQKVQVYDMVFSNDMTMTADNIRSIAEASKYEVEIKDGFDSSGNVVIESLVVNGEKFILNSHKNSEECGELVENGLLEDENYYMISVNYNSENCFYKTVMEFESLGTRDGVLAYLAENGFVEAEKEQSYGVNVLASILRLDDVEFVDTLHYLSNGEQSISIYRMRTEGETDQEISAYNRHYDGGHMNLLEVVKVTFNTDGTIDRVHSELSDGLHRFLVLGEQID